MSAPEPPSIGAARCMIYRTNRLIPTACDQCRMSDVYCQAVDDTCCTGCTHIDHLDRGHNHTHWG